MSDIGGGNGGFDARFFAIESVGAILILLFVVVLIAWRGFRGYELPRWPALVLVVAALVLGPGISVYWQIAYPSANGIEGAGRFIFGGAPTLGNAAFAGLGAFAMLDRRARWLAFAPAGLVIAFWLAFLM
jgi:hypothetical protein